MNIYFLCAKERARNIKKKQEVSSAETVSGVYSNRKIECRHRHHRICSELEFNIGFHSHSTLGNDSK